MVQAIPDRYHSLTAYIFVKDAAKAIDFYRKAFGAEEVFRMPGPDGKIMHAEIRIGGSMLMLSDENPQMGAKAPESLGGTSAAVHLYVEDVDTVFARAIEEGATVKSPVADMFWGDRYGRLTDPFGHDWGSATHTEDISPEEMAQRAAEFMSSLESSG